MAGIILGVAPRAELYIAKIWLGSLEDAAAEPTKTKTREKKAIYDSIEAVSCKIPSI